MNKAMILIFLLAFPFWSSGLERLRGNLVSGESSALDFCFSETDFNVMGECGATDYEQIALLPSNRLEAIFTELVIGNNNGGTIQNGSPNQPQTTSFSGAVGVSFSPQTLLAKILGCMGMLHFNYCKSSGSHHSVSR